MLEKRYVFGYGSILNPMSAAKDIEPKCFVRWVQLRGFERIYDAPVDDYLSLNLRPNPKKAVDGMLFDATYPAIFAAFQQREKGYTPHDVTEQLSEIVDGTVYVFVMQNVKHPDRSIPRSYYDLCANAVPLALRSTWIAETIIENPIAENA